MSTLFSKISDNGYKILYLTNSPLADWHAKKGGTEGALPRGPVLCPPEVLFRGSSSKDRRGHQQEVGGFLTLMGWSGVIGWLMREIDG